MYREETNNLHCIEYCVFHETKYREVQGLYRRYSCRFGTGHVHHRPELISAGGSFRDRRIR